MKQEELLKFIHWRKNENGGADADKPTGGAFHMFYQHWYDKDAEVTNFIHHREQSLWNSLGSREHPCSPSCNRDDSLSDRNNAHLEGLQSNTAESFAQDRQHSYNGDKRRQTQPSRGVQID